MATANSRRGIITYNILFSIPKDSRNEKVYHEVANKLLDFKVRRFDGRICIFDPQDETIYLCKDARIEDFMHELLYAFIRSNQVYSMGAFEIQLGSYPAIKELFE